MLYLILFITGICEEFINIAYYRLAYKNLKFLCGLVSMIRVYIWAFVIQTIFKDLQTTFYIISSYAIGGAIGDYLSLSCEPFIDKVIFKFQRKGRKKKRLYLINERKE